MEIGANAKTGGGVLAVGQLWQKGRTERLIVGFDHFYMYYKSKTDIKKGMTTGVLRSTFSKWLTSGDGAVLKEVRK